MSTIVPKPTDALKLAREFARRFAEKLDPIRFRVFLFGSRARGDADQESDLDLFIEIDDEDAGESLRAWADEVAVEMTLRHAILFSPIVADRPFLEKRKGYSLLEAVAEEGILVEP